MDPVETVDELGAKWSTSFDDYASGRIDASQIRCVLCRVALCECPPFGTPEYLEMVGALHGK
jgi:hypothetical protein